MPTPHINAQRGDIAPTVLMPGDPKRAKRIAEHLFDEPRLINDVRGMFGFTGVIDGQRITVMGSGMGQPSLAIYATELFRDYDVRQIIRVGTCGGIAASVDVGDCVVATGAHTDSNFNQGRIPGIYFAAVASPRLVAAATAAHDDSFPLHVGTIVSRDHFYGSPAGQNEGLAKYGVLGVEMESAALYGIAAEYGKDALTVLTVSDHLFSESPEMTSEERENRFDNALRLALAAALS